MTTTSIIKDRIDKLYMLSFFVTAKIPILYIGQNIFLQNMETKAYFQTAGSNGFRALHLRLSTDAPESITSDCANYG